MENLKVGQSFEVVEVLSSGGFNQSKLVQDCYKINGFTIYDGHNALANGTTVDNEWYYMRIDVEVKIVGKLTITKLK